MIGCFRVAPNLGPTSKSLLGPQFSFGLNLPMCFFLYIGQILCAFYVKKKKMDNFMCLLESECAKRLKAHSRAIPVGWIQIDEFRTGGVARIPHATSRWDSPIWIQPLKVFHYNSCLCFITSINAVYVYYTRLVNYRNRNPARGMQWSWAGPRDAQHRVAVTVINIRRFEVYIKINGIIYTKCDMDVCHNDKPPQLAAVPNSQCKQIDSRSCWFSPLFLSCLASSRIANCISSRLICSFIGLNQCLR